MYSNIILPISACRLTKTTRRYKLNSLSKIRIIQRLYLLGCSKTATHLCGRGLHGARDEWRHFKQLAEHAATGRRILSDADTLGDAPREVC
jgi:hypothetical protein